MEKNQYNYSINFYQFLPAYLTKFKPTKHIIWIHGSLESFFTGFKKIFKKAYGGKLNKYDEIVAISAVMKGQIESFYPGLSKNKLHLIYNSFDFNSITNRSNDISNLCEYDLSLLNSEYMYVQLQE